MAVEFKNDWQGLLAHEFQKEYYTSLHRFLAHEYHTYTVYPSMYDIFNCLHYTAYGDVKVVIIGQDPYHGPGQAHGLSFSVQPGISVPPSLQNIYQELHDDVGCYIPQSGYLKKWTDQGVLLLNAVLTVRAGMANSHRGKGWEIFTDHIISLLNDRPDPVVFLLWGRNAREGAHHQPPAFDSGGAAPQPLFCNLWLLRMPPLFQDQCVSGAQWDDSHRLAD